MREIFGLIVAFTPFIFFWIMVGRSVQIAAWGAFLAGLLLLTVNLLRRRLHIFEIIALLFFGFFAFFFSLMHVGWAEQYAAAIVHGGVVAIALATILTGRPFTLDYAREHAPQKIWQTADFLAANRNISWVWTGGFTVTTLAAIAVVTRPADTCSLLVYKIGLPLSATGGPLIFTL